MKKLFLVALALSSALCVSAQKLIVQDYQSSPYWYGGVKGGIQWVPTNYDFGSLIAPAFGVQLGRQMTPVVGIRGDFQGLSGVVVEDCIQECRRDDELQVLHHRC